jgi:hypothetical protein
MSRSADGANGGVASRCSEPPSPGLLRGIEQFNRREYFECHETLELIWNAEPGPIRTLYNSSVSQWSWAADCAGALV